MTVAVSGEDEASLRALAYAMENMPHKERMAAIKAYGIDQRIEELFELESNGIGPDGFDGYRARRKRQVELEAQKEGLQQ